MSSEGFRLRLAAAESYAVVPNSDGDLTAVAFRVHGNWLGAVFDDADLNGLACCLVQRAAEMAAVRTLGIASSKQTTVSPSPQNPIPVTLVTAAIGRSKSEILLGVGIGDFTLTFALDPSTLLHTCLDALAELDGALPSRSVN